MLEKAKAMTDEEFQTMVKSVLVELEAKDKNLNEENSRFWRTEIANHRYMFDRTERKIEAIKQITKSQWQQSFEELFFTKCRRVDFRYNSYPHTE
jgi:secreted Zn-dependent insulinase-like peptidase